MPLTGCEYRCESRDFLETQMNWNCVRTLHVCCPV